jgi:hypothetical protein
VTISVVNDAGARQSVATAAGTGTGTGSGGGFSVGFGQVGMLERARAVGGTLHAGPRPDGGYEVTADLPAIAPSPQEDIQP